MFGTTEDDNGAHGRCRYHVCEASANLPSCEICKLVVQVDGLKGYIFIRKARTGARNVKGLNFMAQFKDREKAFENKFKRDQEFDFKVSARRNKLLGIWVAEQLSLDSDAAEAYAKEVVASDFDEPGDDDVLQKVLGDLQGKGVETSEHLVRKEMDRLMSVAREQVSSET